MGEEESTNEVGKVLANRNLSPTKPDNDPSEMKDGYKEENLEEAKSEAMEVDDEENLEEQRENKDSEVGDLKEEENKSEEIKKGGSKKRATKKSGEEKGTNKKVTEKKGEVKKEFENKGKEKNVEPKTPVGPTIERPVRERKSVQRLVAIFDQDSSREFIIEKGRGTALKDIPNVAFKFSKKKVADETLKLLHGILYARRGKASEIKSNILNFSGFVWVEIEEKQIAKVHEKLDKYTTEKLFEFCDLLDISVTRTTAKKEEVIAKLIDFLVIPHITTSELLSEKEEPSKGNKRKRSSKKSPISGDTPSNDSSKKKKTKSESEEKSTSEKEDSEEEQDQDQNEYEENNDQQKVNGDKEKSESEEHVYEPEPEPELESGENSKKRKRDFKKPSSSKKESAPKTKSKKEATEKKSSQKKKPSAESSSSGSISKDQTEEPTPKTLSKKKKICEVNDKPSTPKKSASKEISTSKEKSGKKAVKQDKPKEEKNKVKEEKPKPKEEKQKLKEDKLNPSDEELKSAVSEILKEVDFNTATFTDILKLLNKRFDTDLTPRKTDLKFMIRDELIKIADEIDDEDEGEPE